MAPSDAEFFFGDVHGASFGVVLTGGITLRYRNHSRAGLLLEMEQGSTGPKGWLPSVWGFPGTPGILGYGWPNQGTGGRTVATTTIYRDNRYD